jgi:hypothetical protein
MKFLSPLLLAASLLLSSTAFAEGGSEKTLERITVLRDKAQATLVQAQQAPKGQRLAPMAEHMQMLEQMMTQLHASHPDKSMTPARHLAWMEEHDQLMDDLLKQMQAEHQLMMSEFHQ